MESLILNVGPAIASVLILITYIPQLKLTFQTKNVEGQSLSFWVLLSITLGLLLLQQIGLMVIQGVNTWTGILSQSFNFICSMAMLIMVVKYKK